MTTLLTALIVLAMAFNVYATVVLRRSPRHDRRQKRLQLGLIWLLPVIGADSCSSCDSSAGDGCGGGDVGGGGD